MKARDGDIITIPANTVDCIDTTGAGDMYAAGFLYGWCNGFSLRDSGVLASFLASQIVNRHGAQFNHKTAQEIAQIVHEGKWDYCVLPVSVRGVWERSGPGQPSRRTGRRAPGADSYG